jgi:hypothetical protein
VRPTSQQNFLGGLMATSPTKKHGTNRLNEPPSSPSAVADKIRKIGRQEDSWLRSQLEKRGSLQKNSTFNKLVKAGCSVSSLTLLHSDFILWGMLDELRPRRAQIVSAHRKLVTAYDALKGISDVYEETLPFVLENEFKRRYPVHQRQLLTLGCLKQRIDELDLVISSLTVHRGAPRKLSRDYFMTEFHRQVVPSGRALDQLAAQLYSELSKKPITPSTTTGVNASS